MRLEDYKRLQDPFIANHVPGRHVWTASDRLRHANAIIDTVAVVETYTTARLLSVVPALTEQEASTWQKRESAWLRHGGVDFGTLRPTWSKVSGFVEVRNALQHGLGRLTDSQLSKRRRDSVLEAIRATSITLNGDLVVLRSGDVTECSGVCADFISSLDVAAPT
jgi:hypothetical protein